MKTVTAALVSLAMVFAFASPAAATTNATWVNSSGSKCHIFAKGPEAAQVRINPGKSSKDTYDHVYIPVACKDNYVTKGATVQYPPSGKWFYIKSNAWSKWTFRVR